MAQRDGDPRRVALRRLLAARLDAGVARRLALARGERAVPITDLEARHAGLATTRARTTLAELRLSGGELERSWDSALAHHLVRIAGEHQAADAFESFELAWDRAEVRTRDDVRCAPAALFAATGSVQPSVRARWADALLPAARDAVASWLELRADEAAGRSEAAVELGLARGPERAALPERAQSFLDATADLAREAARYLAPPGPVPTAWHELIAAAEAPAADDRVEAGERRVRRATAWLVELGLAESLARSVRIVAVEPPVALALAAGRARVALVAGAAGGERAEREMLGAVGEAVARALVDPALPLEASWPAWPLLPRLGGALAERLLARPGYLLRFLEVPKRDAERLARRFALAGTLRLRVAAAGCVAAASGPRGREAAMETGRAAFARVAGVAPPPELAALALPRRWRVEVDLLARFQALEVERALVERHDEDFYRNPRCASSLRALCSPGALATTDSVRDATGAGSGERPAETLLALLGQTGAV